MSLYVTHTHLAGSHTHTHTHTHTHWNSMDYTTLFTSLTSHSLYHTQSKQIVYFIQGVGLASHSLLVHGFHLCMEGYRVHGTSVTLCSMNNKTMVQRPGVLEISSLLHTCTVLYTVHVPYNLVN